MKKNVVIEKGDYIKLYKWRTAQRKCRKHLYYYNGRTILGIEKNIWEHITMPDTVIRVKEVLGTSVFCAIIAADGTNEFTLYIPKRAVKAMWRVTL